jgi:hypothetical protein
VVVILKNQLTASTPSLNQQNSVLAALPDTKPNHVAHFSVGNAFTADVTAAQAAALAGNSSVAAVPRPVPGRHRSTRRRGQVRHRAGPRQRDDRGRHHPDGQSRHRRARHPRLVTPVSVAADLSLLLRGIVTTSGDVLASLPYGYVVGSD